MQSLQTSAGGKASSITSLHNLTSQTRPWNVWPIPAALLNYKRCYCEAETPKSWIALNHVTQSASSVLGFHISLLRLGFNNWKQYQELYFKSFMVSAGVLWHTQYARRRLERHKVHNRSTMRPWKHVFLSEESRFTIRHRWTRGLWRNFDETLQSSDVHTIYIYIYYTWKYYKVNVSPPGRSLPLGAACDMIQILDPARCSSPLLPAADGTQRDIHTDEQTDTQGQTQGS